MEIWKDIPGYEGKMQVSNVGHIRSLLRGEPYVLKTQKDSKGYHRVRVTINHEKRSIKLHRAVIPNTDCLPQVNHKDGNKDNNAVSNLEWVTNRENAHHAIENGLWETVFAGAEMENNARKKPVIAVNATTGEKLTFESVRSAEAYFKSRHISAVLRGKREHAKGFTFRYGGDAVCQS